MTLRVLSLGDAAFTVEFASGFDGAARRAVVRLDFAIVGARAEGRLPGVVDTGPTFRLLTVHHDPLAVSRADLEPQIGALVEVAEG